MKRYLVIKREVWVQSVSVEAESEQDAIQKVRRGNGDVVNDTLEYSHDMSENNWTAEEDKGN